jgi:hypothetical protein
VSQYSETHFGTLVRTMVPEPIDHRDYVWLCNQLVKLAHRYRYECVDSFRVCVSQNGAVTHQYESAITCCVQHDVEVTNPVTTNKFWIGCNYGH